MIRKIGVGILQVALLCGMTWVGDEIVERLPIKVPGSIVGLLLLFFLLKAKIIRLHWVELGANFMLAEMLLFFIPPFVGIVNYKELIVTKGPLLAGIIMLSTICVMVGTGLLAEYLYNRRKAKHDERTVRVS